MRRILIFCFLLLLLTSCAADDGAYQKGFIFEGEYFTNDGLNSLVVTKNASEYDVKINIYRLTSIEGSGIIQENTMYFTGLDPCDNKIKAEIKLQNSGEISCLEFVKSTWGLLPNGTTIMFERKSKINTKDGNTQNMEDSNTVPFTFDIINAAESEFLQQLQYEKTHYIELRDCGFNNYVGSIDEEIYKFEFTGEEKYYMYGWYKYFTVRSDIIVAVSCDSFQKWGENNTYQLLKKMGLDVFLDYTPEIINYDISQGTDDIYLRWEGENGYLIIYTLWYDGYTEDWKDSRALNYCIVAK